MSNKTEIKDKPLCENFEIRKNLLDKVLKLPIDPPVINTYSGKRETNNKTRIFFNSENCKKYECLEEIAEIFNSDKIVSTLSLISGNDLSKGKLLNID